MATFLENLIIARDKATQELADFDYSKTSYSIDGQSVQWDVHLANLTARAKELAEQVSVQDTGEIISRGRSV